MTSHLAEIRVKNHNNAKAQVVTSFVVNFIEMVQDLEAQQAPEPNNIKKREMLLKAIVAHADRGLSCDLNQLDSYLASWLLVNKAYSLKRQNKIQVAYECVRDAIRIDKESNSPSAVTLYNGACYACMNDNLTECFTWLKEAIHLDPANRADAASDSDFNKVKANPDFLSIINQQ